MFIFWLTGSWSWIFNMISCIFIIFCVSNLRFNHMICPCFSFWSHKQEVLKFLDELCSLYEHDYLQKSSSQTEILKAFIEKVSDLADAHKLPSRNYQSLMMESSVVDLQNHLNKVSSSSLGQSCFGFSFYTLGSFSYHFKLFYLLHISTFQHSVCCLIMIQR